MKKYYVYTHSDMSGKVFYVGKGTGNRAWTKRDGKAWKNKYGVEIVFDGLTEEEALDAEAVLIDSYGIENLANRKKESVSDKTASLEWYKIYQYSKDLIWLKENIDKINYKDKFIKEQIEIIEFSDSLRKQIQLLNS
jgi:hypothetical protein